MIKSIIKKNKLLSKFISFIIGNRNKIFIQEYYQNFYNKKISNKEIKKISRDLEFSKMYYKISKMEYFQFNFADLSDSGRKKYIGNVERHEIYKKIGNERTRNILNDKYESYNKLKKFYKREIIKIENDNDFETFNSFCKKHERFIIKAINQSCGNNIKIYDTKKETIEQIWKNIKKIGTCIAEELICQSTELAKFHPESVNTIRICTYYQNEKVDIPFAFIRMGRGQNIVDNGGQGGIFASIDVNTGIVNSIGKTKELNEFIQHPDTQKIIPGFRIPNWEKLIKISIEAANSFQEHQLIGWDFALTQGGWIMVEANAEGEFIANQICSGGCRENVGKYFR